VTLPRHCCRARADDIGGKVSSERSGDRNCDGLGPLAVWMSETHNLRYIHLRPGDVPPFLQGIDPFKAILVIEEGSTPEWQTLISDWLVRSGCRYLMAWGHECEQWHDAVDKANIRAFGSDASGAQFAMTTCHDHEPVEEVFWFSEFCADHPSLDLESTYIVHIAREGRSAELLDGFRDVRRRG
jgi:hypothetical protein